MSSQPSFDNFPGPSVLCNPKGDVKKLLPGIELVKMYKPNEQIQLQLVVGNAHESIALESAALFLNFSEELIVSPSGDWAVNEKNKSISIYLKEPVFGTTCNRIFGTVNVQFPKAGIYRVSAHLTGHNIKSVNSKITLRLNQENH